MKLSYGVFHEGYKIAGPIRPAKDIQNAPKSIHLTMGRNDFMPFTVLLSADAGYSVQLGSYAWFTERGDVPTVRLAIDFSLPVKAFHEQTHIDHRSQIAYADALLPADVKEYGLTILEPKPRRVRNIFICSRLVFWASSRMIKESSSVRPRI